MNADKGILIAIFGPDGSGKSTAADFVQNIIFEKGWLSHRYHWRPGILPGSILKYNTNIDITSPDTHPLRSWVSSMFMYLYYYFDFLLGYFFKFRQLLGKGEFIINERYFYDILFHPRRYRLKSINFLANLLSYIIPKPDLIVLLHGEPSVIFDRKPELSIAEIKRQQEKMMKYLVKFGSVLYLDVTCTSSQEVASRIFQEYTITKFSG